MDVSGSNLALDDQQLCRDLAELFHMSYEEFALGLCEPLPNARFGCAAGKLFRHYLKENHPVAMKAVGHRSLMDFAMKLMVLSQISEEDLAGFAHACGVTTSVLLDWSVGKDTSLNFDTNLTTHLQEGVAQFSAASPEVQKNVLLHRSLAPLAMRMLQRREGA
jgi:hypothetical protein